MKVLSKTGDWYTVSIKEDDIFVLQESLYDSLWFSERDKNKIEGFLLKGTIDKDTYERLIYNNRLLTTKIDSLITSLRKIEEK